MQESGSLFSTGGELNITGSEITKRRTDPDNFSDVIYLDVSAENADIMCTLSYIMRYELYNDGWLLESVERDYEGLWLVVPLHGMTDEEIQEKIDYYISEGWYDAVELLDRDTELTETGCTETVTMAATRDHLYGTEEFVITQTWYFDPNSCRYTAVVADPSIVESSLTLKDTILGAEWQCSRYHGEFSAWPDQFHFTVEELTEEDGEIWVKFIINRERNTYWDLSNDEPAYWSMSSRFVVSTFMKYWAAEDKWAFNLESKNEYLYSEDDDERFTSDSWFCFSLDQSEVGYIAETDDIV